MPRKIIENDDSIKGIKGRRGDGHDKAPFLYMRSLIPDFNDLDTTFDDQGLRPFQPGQIAYLSPAIKIFNQQGVSVLNLSSGQNHDVKIEVKNRGDLPTPNAYLELYWSYPTTCFTLSNSFPIGNAIVNVQGNSSSVASIPWIPQDSGSFFKIHKCLLARVQSFIPQDMQQVPSDLNILSAWGDRHVAQKNIHIINSAQPIIDFGFLIGSSNSNANYKIVPKQVVVPPKKQVIITKLLNAKQAFSSIPLKSAEVHIGETVNLEKDDVKKMSNKGMKKADASFKIKKDENKLAMFRLERTKGDAGIKFVALEQIDEATGCATSGLLLIIVS